MGAFLYLLVVEVSLFAIGATAVACVVLAVHRPSRWWAYVGAKASMCGLIGIILIRVLPVRVIEINVYSVGYVVCLLVLTLCMPYVAGDVIRRTAKPKAAVSGH